MNTYRSHISLGTRKGFVIFSLITLLFSGCATFEQQVGTPTPPTTKSPETASPLTYQPKLGPAASLYSQANDAIVAGNYSRAEQLLERALKIEPKNSYYWHVLGKVKYSQGQYPQVVQLCLKSKSLAGNDAQLRQMNDQLIAKAQSQLP